MAWSECQACVRSKERLKALQFYRQGLYLCMPLPTTYAKCYKWLCSRGKGCITLNIARYSRHDRVLVNARQHRSYTGQSCRTQFIFQVAIRFLSRPALLLLLLLLLLFFVSQRHALTVHLFNPKSDQNEMSPCNISAL